VAFVVVRARALSVAGRSSQRGLRSQRSPIRCGRGHFQLDWIASSHAMQETGFTMNSIARRAQHPDHGLSAIPSVNLTDGVNLTHQLALDSDAQFHLFSSDHLDSSPWKSAHQAALVGLSRFFPRLVHDSALTPLKGSADDQDRREREDPCIALTDGVEGESGADADKRGGHAIGLHGSGLGVAQLGPDTGVSLLAKHLTSDLPFGIDLSLERVSRVHVPAPSEALVKVLNIDAGKSREALAVFGCEWLKHSPILAIRYKNCKRFAKYVGSLSARTQIMETKGDRRRRKLIELATAVDGGLPVIADRAKCSVASLQQLIDVTPLPTKKDGTWSRKQMGDGTAQRIEDAFNYPRGWFDTDAPTKDQAPANELHAALALIASYGKSVTALRREDVGRKLSEMFLQPERFNEYADDILRWLNPPSQPQFHSANTQTGDNKTSSWYRPKGLDTDGDSSQIPAPSGKGR
jgi:hypothetical protein